MYLSYSKIGTWKRCWKKFNYKYIQGLKTKKYSAAPSMGSLGHKGLEKWIQGEDWKVGMKEYWKDQLDNIPEKFIPDEIKEDYDLVMKVMKRLTSVHDYYRCEDEFDFIEPETRFEVKIPTTNDTLVGYMDRVIKVPNEGLWLVDYKFTTGSVDSKLKNLELKEQIDYYIWALKQQFPDEIIQGAIFHAIALDIPTIPQPIKSGKRLTKRQMKTDYDTYYRAIIDNGFDPIDYEDKLTELKYQDDPFTQFDWINRGSVELQKIEKELIQVTKAIKETIKYTPDIRNRRAGRCGWDCDFKELCLTEKKGGDIQYIIENDFEQK